MIKNYAQSIAAGLALLLAGSASAQRTGSFDTTTLFQGSPRALSVHVPASYDPANKYQLIVGLHGLGDTCNNYRSALVSSLNWGAAMPNTIFVCPSPATRTSDFFDGTGGEAMIYESIRFAMDVYHIDTSDVILQGFSLGGRAALRYGLDSHALFKGLLLNTPAVQGVKEAVNERAPYYAFNYANASKIPIYMTFGATDLLYSSPLDSVYEALVLNDGIVRYTVYPTMGHNIPPVAQIIDFNTFFSTPGNPGKDAAAVRVYTPLSVCNTASAAAGVLIHNTGRDVLTSVKYTYTVGSTTATGTWTGNLLPFQHAIAPFTAGNLAAGNNTITVRIDTLNGNLPDAVVGNNVMSTELMRSNTGLTSLNEGFEGASFPPPGWMLQQSGDVYTLWAEDNSVAKTGNQSANAFNTILIFDNTGRKDALITPLVTLPSVRPTLSFDVAYNFHRYTPPFSTADIDFADTLEVLISNDCGANYTSLYRKGGANLATFATPILNPLSLNDVFTAPADSNWRKEVIDLSGFATGGNPVYVKFNYISALGGSINIDNVAIGSASGVAPVSAARFEVFPNPASDEVIIRASERMTGIQLLDVAGKTMLHVSGTSDEQKLNTRHLPAGIYQLRIQTETGLHTQKLIIAK